MLLVLLTSRGKDYSHDQLVDFTSLSTWLHTGPRGGYDPRVQGTQFLRAGKATHVVFCVAKEHRPHGFQSMLHGETRTGYLLK